MRGVCNSQPGRARSGPIPALLCSRSRAWLPGGVLRSRTVRRAGSLLVLGARVLAGRVVVISASGPLTRRTGLGSRKDSARPRRIRVVLAIEVDFDLDYPTMGRVQDVLAAVLGTGFALIDLFALPDEAWWDDFYAPMERRIGELRGRYAGDAEAQAVLDRLAQEPEMHRRCAGFYAYEFFVGRRTS